MFVCAMATTLPTIIVSVETTARMGVMSPAMAGNASANTRSSAANPAIFAPAAMNAVTADGAPWYTSGVHIWNGTAATLNPSPTMMSAAPTVSNNTLVLPAVAADTILLSAVVPVAPNTSAMPYTTKPVENAPSRKYFSPASSELACPRANAESTYRGLESISSA